MITKPYELNGNQLGMSLDGLKAKNRRIVAGTNKPAPWCDREPSTGLVHCRLAFSSTKPDGRPTSTVAGVPTVQLLYSFVDNQLFKITAELEPDDTERIHAALVAKFGEPDNQQERDWTWNNGVSAIHLTEGNSGDRTNLVFLHQKLGELASARIAQSHF